MTIPTPEICERLRRLDARMIDAPIVCHEAADLIQQQQATIERLSAALEGIESYKWPEFVGEYTETFFGEATGAEYKLKHPITKETSLRALNNVKAIARAALGKDAR